MPDQDEPEFRAFYRDIFAVLSAVLDSLERFPPKEMKPVPADWPETQAMLRTVAEDLMLCQNVAAAVEKLRDHQGILLVLVTLTTEVEDAAVLRTIRSAHATSPMPSTALPGQAFAALLLEIAKGDAPIWRRD